MRQKLPKCRRPIATWPLNNPFILNVQQLLGAWFFSHLLPNCFLNPEALTVNCPSVPIDHSGSVLKSAGVLFRHQVAPEDGFVTLEKQVEV